MPLTRKQAWRRVRVRHEPGETKDEFSARCKRSEGDMTQQQQQPQQRRDERSPERAAVGAPRVRSPEKNDLEKWKLPKEGRNPSARPGISAAKRQAAAACVRVGSRVSFNTVVAAILIPSAKDLHAAARQELWWQETDYRDFRINFIQFMRTPPVLADGPEMVPVEIIVAGSTPGAPAAQEEKQAPETDDAKPVVVGAVVYNDARCDPRATEGVRAWPVEPEVSLLTASGGSGGGVDSGDRCVKNIEGESAPSLAAAAAVAAAAAASGSEPDTAPPTPPEDMIGDSVEPERVSPGEELSGVVLPQTPPPLIDTSDFAFGGDEDGAPRAADDGGGCWEEQERNRRVEPPRVGLESGKAPVEAAEEEDEGEEDGEDNTIRVRRSFSNLETATRRGAGLDSEIASDDTSDSDDGGGAGRSHHPQQTRRPRALSLDGWFTCGLENGIDTKSYETHDHAGRLRQRVKLAPFPTVCVTPPPAKSHPEKVDLAEVLQRLRASFNVSADSDSAKGKSPTGAADGSSGDADSKRRAFEGGAPVECSPVTAANRKVAELAAVGPRSTSRVDVCVA